MDKISVIVPCFNEEDVLPLFYKEVTHVLESIEKTMEGKLPQKVISKKAAQGYSMH